MSTPVGRIAWIAIAPVKAMGLVFLDHARLELDGIPGDRRFALIDERDRLFNAKRAGPLATIAVTFEPANGRLALRFPDGVVVDGPTTLGARIAPTFFGEPRPARLVAGPWDAVLSAFTGQPLRLVAMEPGEGADRGPTATLLSSAALASLAAAGGLAEPLDRRRFRMTFGIDRVAAHAEDGWIGRDVRIGGATVRIAGNVGRCAVTTHDPDTGRPSFDTLRILNETRGRLATSEPLPFGVWSEIVVAGAVALGDPVDVLP